MIRTVDGFEPNEFRNLFPFWHNVPASGNKAKTVLGRIDTKILNERASLAAETQLIDDGAGDVMIYKVGKSNLIKVPQRHAQCLFSTETYVIHYTLMVSTLCVQQIDCYEKMRRVKVSRRRRHEHILF